MPPLTSAQAKSLHAQFVNITGCSDRAGHRALREANYVFREALDRYFTANPTAVRPLEDLFDKLKTSPEDDANQMGADSSMAYFTSLGANLENASLFLALETVQAPSIGVITREGFVNGWKLIPIEANVASQSQYFSQQLSLMFQDRSVFKRVYRYAFVVGKEQSQRALSLENALIYWDILLTKTGWEWKSANVDWLEEWKTFLSEKWSRSVSRDMWNQLLEFAFQSCDDESLSFWNEDAAWPGVIDEFVMWYRTKEQMEVDA